MFMQRKKGTARWAKSRHTPRRSTKAPMAVRAACACGYPNWRCEFTKSQMACTRAQPGGEAAKLLHATFMRCSVSQYRLPSRNIRASCGNSLTSCWRAAGSIGSGRPETAMTASVKTLSWPCGATSRAQIVERIPITRERHRRRDLDVIRLDEVRRSRWMHVEHQHYGSLLGELVDELEANAELH